MVFFSQARWCGPMRAKLQGVVACTIEMVEDPRFQRTWEFYLAYCEAGFDARSIDVVQYTLIKDGERPASSGTLL